MVGTVGVRVARWVLLGGLAALVGGCEEVPWDLVHHQVEEAKKRYGRDGGAPDAGGVCNGTPVDRARYTGRLELARRYGSVGGQGAGDIGSDGRSMYVVGTAQDGRLDFGGGARLREPGSYLARLDTAGRGRWVRRFSVPVPNQFPSVMAPTTDARGRVAVTVGYSEALFLDGRQILPRPPALYFASVVFDEWGRLVRVDEPGPLWSLSAFDRAGNLYTVMNEVLIRQAPDGTVVGERELVRGQGDAGHFRPRAVKTDPQGNLLVLAEYNGTWLLRGTPLATDASGWGVVLFRIAFAGGSTWYRSFAGPDGYSDIAADSRGNILAVGRVGVAPNMVLVVDKRDPNGGPIFGRGYLAPSWQATQRVEVDPWDNVVVAAFVDEPVDLGGGPMPLNGVGSSGEGRQLAMAVGKLDPCGTHLWSRLIDDGFRTEGGSLGMYVPAVATDGRGSTLVVGGFAGALDVAGTPLRARAGWDVYFARFAR